MLLGTAKACITPPLGTWMAGYGFRTKPCESISEDIYVRVHAHCTNEKKVVYIYADLAEWDNLVVKSLRASLKEAYGLAEDDLVFLASHTHCGPVVGHDSLLNTETTEDPAYTAYVEAQVMKAVGLALQDIRPVTMTRYNGESYLNVFRRIYENGEIVMQPNYTVPADRHLTVLVLRDEAGTIRGIMVHYPCHANMCKGYSIHGDYPGAALRMLDELYPDSVALFLQGCTGDLRPNCVCGDMFIAASYEQMLDAAKRFVNDCQLAMSGHGIPVEGSLRNVTIKANLPLENVKTNEELEAILANTTSFEAAWAAKVLERGNHGYEVLELGLVRYGEGLSIYTINGEVVQSYAAYARVLDPDAITAAYANGMVGYMPNALEIVEGGYEPRDSAPYFGLAGTYSTEIDRIIRHSMEELKKIK